MTDSYCHGWAVKNSRPMAADSKLRAASLSKVIIAMTAMKMQEEGIVSLDANIGDYWGAKPYKSITLRHLLTHTSTLQDITPGGNASAIITQLRTSSNYTSGTPGSGVWNYNNFGAALAGSTLEMAAGVNIDSYADSKIFNSLGIDAAWMSGRVDTSKLATIYRDDGSVGRSASTSATLVGSNTPGSNTAYYAGGFTTSAAEYGRLIAILANDGTYGGVRYLSADSVAQIEKKQLTRNSGKASEFDQCIALRHKKNLYGQSELYYHTGNAYGLLSLASYNPSTGNGVVVFTTGCTQGTDSSGIYAVCGNISRYLYEYLDRQPQKPATAIDIGQAELELRKGDSLSIVPILTPADSDSEIEWESSCPACVEVSGDGTVTARGHGTAIITATAGEISDSCLVTVTPPDIKLTMMGASVRITEPYGLRFGTRLYKDAEYASAEIVEYGTLVLGTAALGDSQLTLETPRAKRIPAVNIYQETNEYIMYTGVIINIPFSAFDAELTGRGYLIYRNADGTEGVVYTDSASMSFGYAARGTYDVYAGMENLTNTQRTSMEILKKLLGIKDEESVVTPSDMETPSDVVTSSDAVASTDVQNTVGQEPEVQDQSAAEPVSAADAAAEQQ